MTLWELAACVAGYNKANGAGETVMITVDEFDLMMAEHADFVSPTLH